MARKRPMPPALKAYWASKRRGKVARTSRKSRPAMARRRTSRKSSFRGVTRGINQNALINGALGGAGAAIATGYIGPEYGPAAGLAAVGVWRKDPTLQTLAGISIGSKLASRFSLPGAGSMASPGGVL